MSESVPEIDLIQLEIQWQRLISIMDEVDNAVIKTSFSTIVGESHDFACILPEPMADQKGPQELMSSIQIRDGSTPLLTSSTDIAPDPQHRS